MNKSELKKYLDKLVIKYETENFIKDDPIQFPHRFKNKNDIEISGLIATCLAFGKREKIIEAVGKIHDIMQNEPYNFCLNFTKKEEKAFENFKYRYVDDKNIIELFWGISKVIKKYPSLEDLFFSYDSDKYKTIKEGLTGFVSEIITSENYLLPHPAKKSACKRLNLYLKWMVRKSPVDIGIWEKIDKRKLIIPLDVHVARVSRELGLLNRKANDWESAAQITEILKYFDPNDPTKYDFALFGAGIDL